MEILHLMLFLIIITHFILIAWMLISIRIKLPIDKHINKIQFLSSERLFLPFWPPKEYCSLLGIRLPIDRLRHIKRPCRFYWKRVKLIWWMYYIKWSSRPGLARYYRKTGQTGIVRYCVQCTRRAINSIVKTIEGFGSCTWHTKSSPKFNTTDSYPPLTQTFNITNNRPTLCTAPNLRKIQWV
jgi:hypothetical protein